MKNKLAIVGWIVAAVALLLIPRTSFADSVNVSVVSPSTVVQGNAFTVDVDIANAADLFDFQLDLNFDPAVLQASDALEGTFLSGDGSTFFIPGVIDNGVGSIAFNADTLLSSISGVDGSGVLLEFDFTALAPGTSSLDVENLILQDSPGNLVDGAITNGSVTVTGGVPVSTAEPDTLLLLATALCSLAILHARLSKGHGQAMAN